MIHSTAVDVRIAPDARLVVTVEDDDAGESIDIRGRVPRGCTFGNWGDDTASIPHPTTRELERAVGDALGYDVRMEGWGDPGDPVFRFRVA